LSRARVEIMPTFWRALRNFFADRCLDHAAAVAYYALLALAPSIYLLALVVGRVLNEGDPTGTALARVAQFFPPNAAALVQRVGESLPRHGETAAVVIPALVWIATTAFTTLEGGVNAAFGTVPARKYWLSKLKAFAGAFAVSALLVASVVANHLGAWFERSRQSLGLPPVLGLGVRLVSYLAMLLVAFGTFALFYKMLPRGKVSWAAAARGAALALVLFEVSRRAFGWVIVRSPGFGLMTGTIAGIVAALLWIYTVVVLCLFGAEVAAVLNGNRGVASARRRETSA